MKNYLKAGGLQIRAIHNIKILKCGYLRVSFLLG